MTRLSGKVALVTGASGGIGFAIARRFAAEGARVLATDLTDTRPEEFASSGEAIEYARLDVTLPDDWTTAFTLATRRWGSVDILVNNAGSSRAGSIEEASVEDWRFVMDTNALSVFLGCQHAVRHMREAGGVIVNIASARGKRAGSQQCAYSASKAAVLSMTQSVALHCGEHMIPVRCNAICPGVVDTPMLRRHAAEQSADGAAAMMSALAARGLVGRLAMPKDIANAAVFLASEEAQFMTGASIDVDGGFVIRDL